MTVKRMITLVADDHPELARRALLAVQFHPWEHDEFRKTAARFKATDDATWDDVFAWAAAGDVTMLRMIGDTLSNTDWRAP